MWMCTVVLIIGKKKVKKGKKEQLKHFIFLIYNKEDREAIKGKFNMPGLKRRKGIKTWQYFFSL